jgi:nicotinate-nucleotide adenylyltransferase
MADTLTSLRDEVGSAPLLLLIGQDAANGLNQWHRWRDLFSLAHIVILSRAGDVQRHSRPLSSLIRSQIAAHPQSLLEVPGGRVLRIQVTSLAISSSRIRRLIGDGRSPRFLLPPAVLEYIEEHGLYGAPRQKPK